MHQDLAKEEYFPAANGYTYPDESAASEVFYDKALRFPQLNP
jgi:hypothetical protein